MGMTDGARRGRRGSGGGGYEGSPGVEKTPSRREYDASSTASPNAIGNLLASLKTVSKLIVAIVAPNMAARDNEESFRCNRFFELTELV